MEKTNKKRMTNLALVGLLLTATGIGAYHLNKNYKPEQVPKQPVSKINREYFLPKDIIEIAEKRLEKGLDYDLNDFNDDGYLDIAYPENDVLNVYTAIPTKTIEDRIKESEKE